MIYEDFEGFCFKPETISDLIALENLKRKSMNLPVYGEVNIFIRQLWDYLCSIEGNNMCSIMEFYDGGTFDHLYDFAEGKKTLMELDLVTENLGHMEDTGAIRLIGKLTCLREIQKESD